MNTLDERVMAGLNVLQTIRAEHGRDGTTESKVFGRLLGVLGASSGALFLFDSGDQTLCPEIRAGSGNVAEFGLTSSAVQALSRLDVVVDGAAPARTLARLNGFLRTSGFERWSSLCDGGTLFGVLAVNGTARDLSRSEDQAVLQILAQHLGLQLRCHSLAEQNRKAAFEYNRKVLELATVHDAGLTLSASLQVHEVTAEILELAVGVVDGRAGFLFLRHDRSGRLSLAHQIGLDLKQASLVFDVFL